MAVLVRLYHTLVAGVIQRSRPKGERDTLGSTTKDTGFRHVACTMNHNFTFDLRKTKQTY